MRVTFNAVRDGLAAINESAEQFAEAQWQVSSGRRMRAPSDDPAAAQRVVQERGEIATLDAYTRAGDSSRARLTALDSVLGDVVDKITQALTAAASAQGSTADQTTRDAAAATLTGVRDAIAGDINTTFNGIYLFSGSRADVAPYVRVAGAWTYQGDANAVTVDVDRGRSVAVTMDGRSILQGGDTTDVLTALDNLATAAASGDGAAIEQGIGTLQSAFRRAVEAQSHVGTDEQSVDDGEQRVATLRAASAERLSADEDVNVADAITRMNQAETAYRAALGAVSTASRVSLLDYLK